MQEINTFIFDLDGTLIDSVPDLASALNNTLIELNMPVYTESTVRNWVGNGARTLIERGLSGAVDISHGLESEQVDDALSLFLSHYQDTVCEASTLYEDVSITLNELKKRGFILALVTNKPSAFITPILESYSLNALFSVVLGGDSLPEKKPSALPLLEVCRTVNVPPANCVMVGDSKNDILAAKAAKMKSIGLTYGYNYGEPISTYTPEWVFDSFADILTIVNS